MEKSLSAVLPMFARIKKVPSPYSPEKVIRWLDRIGFKHTLTKEDITNDAFPKNPATLRKLSRLHLLAFPFETSAMHYQDDHLVDVSPQGVYKRLVLDGKGSYCYGLNGLLLGMLRGLGFRAYGGAARVNMSRNATDPLNFDALTHMVIFVQPCADDQTWTYLVDVGFGGSGLSRPISLIADAAENTVMGTTPSEMHRLTQRVLPNSSLEASPSGHPEVEYQLEVSHTCGSDPWKVLYTFSTREFYQCDYDAASFDVCQRPSVRIFWDGIIAVKHFFLPETETEQRLGTRYTLPSVNGLGPYADDSDEGDFKYLGKLSMAGNEVKKNVGVQSEVIKILKTDLERIRVLREMFGVTLDDEDVVHIRGRSAALDG